MIPLNTPVVLSFVGDGTEQIIFPVSFPTFEESNIEAEVITPAGARISLLNETHYVLDSIGIPNTDATFILQVSPDFEWTNPNGLKEDYTLKIKFSTNAFQPAKLRDLGRFAPEVLEKVVDRITMNTLALREIVLEFPDRLTQLENTVIDLSTQVQEQQASIDGLETSVENLSDTVDGLSQNVSDIADSLVDLQADVDALELQATGFETTLADHESRIALLEVQDFTEEVVFKSENFTAEFGKIYVIANNSQSIPGDDVSGFFTINFAFVISSDLEVKVISPSLQETLLVEGEFYPADYTVSGSTIALFGGPDKPWISDGGFGGLAIGWTLVITLKNLSVQLPSPAANKSLYVKKLGSNLVTLLRSASEKIDDVQSNKSLTSTKESVTLISDGVDWFII